MKYTSVVTQIPDLIKALSGVQTYQPYERRYIGEAITHLILLKDLLDDINKKESGNEKSV